MTNTTIDKITNKAKVGEVRKLYQISKELFEDRYSPLEKAYDFATREAMKDHLVADFVEEFGDMGHIKNLVKTHLRKFVLFQDLYYYFLLRNKEAYEKDENNPVFDRIYEARKPL